MEIPEGLPHLELEMKPRPALEKIFLSPFLALIAIPLAACGTVEVKVTPTLTPASPQAATPNPNATVQVEFDATGTPTSTRSPTPDPTGSLKGSLLAEGIHPSFSPDGERIAFANNSLQGYHIWIMDKEGKELEEISNLYHDMSPDWSPDGERIAFQSYGERATKEDRFAIWIVNVDGSNLHQLVEPSDRGDQYPCWSPDGRQIVWSHGHQLWIASITGENARPLTAIPANAYEYCGAWSPSGELIAYLAADTHSYREGIPYKIWFIRPNGEDQRMLSSGISANGVAWSGDSQFLYYSTGDAVMKVDVQGEGEPLKVFEFRYPHAIPHFDFDISPDEMWIAYDVSEPYVQRQIYLSVLEAN